MTVGHPKVSRLRRPGSNTSTRAWEEVPPEFRPTLTALIAHQGVEHKSLFGYFRQHGGLPPLDWFTLAAFAAIAGSGGLANTLFSNYTRDKGWGWELGWGPFPALSAVYPLPFRMWARCFQLMHPI